MNILISKIRSNLYCLTSGLRKGEGSIIPKRSGLYYCDFANLLRLGIFHRMISGTVAVVFMLNVAVPPRTGYAQMLPVSGVNLPVPGAMVSLTSGYQPAVIRGIKLFAENPLRFDFLVDMGESGLEGQPLREEADRLVKYFLAALTVPEKDLWVNLSPYEKERIIPEGFGVTEMGRDLLAQDYILKQLTASLIYPEKELGQKFWERARQKAYEKYGAFDIPVNTFNKVWIVPQRAVVYEHGDMAFVVESRLKVMMEEDYVVLNVNRRGAVTAPVDTGNFDEDNDVGAVRLGAERQASEHLGARREPPLQNEIASQIIRELIIPEIEREVNEGENFTRLRQIYHSMILATWFKKNLRESLLGKIYVDQNKVAGVDVQDKEVKQKIYEQYLEAFKKGVYDYIKEEYDPATQDIVPRKYFSGGTSFDQLDSAMVVSRNPADGLKVYDQVDRAMSVSAFLDPKGNSGVVQRISNYLTQMTSELKPENFVVERLTPDQLNDGDNLPQLHELRKLMKKFYRNRKLDQSLREVWSNPKQINLVLKHPITRKIVGYATGGPLEQYGESHEIRADENYKENNTIYFDFLAVSKNFRDSALGVRLTHEFVKAAWKMGGIKYVTFHRDLNKVTPHFHHYEIVKIYENSLETGITMAYLRVDLEKVLNHKHVARIFVSNASSLKDNAMIADLKAIYGDAVELQPWQDRGIGIVRGGRTNGGLDDSQDIVAVFNEQGDYQGYGASREEVYRDGLWYRAIQIYMVYEEDGRKYFVLQKRSLKKMLSKGKLQATVSGQVLLNEITEDSVLRESSEEGGIVLDPEKLVNISGIDPIKRTYKVEEDGTNNELTSLYYYPLTKEELRGMRENYNLDEVDEFWLIPFDVFEQMVPEVPDLFSRSIQFLMGEGRRFYDHIKTENGLLPLNADEMRIINMFPMFSHEILPWLNQARVWLQSRKKDVWDDRLEDFGNTVSALRNVRIARERIASFQNFRQESHDLFLAIKKDLILEGEASDFLKVLDEIEKLMDRFLEDQYVWEDVKLNELIEEFTMRPKERNVNFVVQQDATNVLIRGDHIRLKVVLRNLIQNAIDAMPDGGDLKIETALNETGDQLIMRVSDTGVGMTEEIKARIFEPYFTTKEKNGTGIGLTLAREIIERHNGTIEVASEEGQGTTFTIVLPLDPRPQDAAMLKDKNMISDISVDSRLAGLLDNTMGQVYWKTGLRYKRILQEELGQMLENDPFKALEEVEKQVGIPGRGEAMRFAVLFYLKKGALRSLEDFLVEYDRRYSRHPQPTILLPRYFSNYLRALTYADFDLAKKKLSLERVETQYGEIRGPSFLRLLKLIRLMRAAPLTSVNLRDFIHQTLASLVISEKISWTEALLPLKDLDPQETLRAAILEWNKSSGMATTQLIFDEERAALPVRIHTVESLGNNFYLRRSDQRLYYRKDLKEEKRFIGSRSPAFMAGQHPDQNSPVREALAVYMGRLIGTNVADTLIEREKKEYFSRGWTYSTHALTTHPDKLSRKDRRKAEAADFVFNVFHRKWDINKAMFNRSPVGESFVSFDHSLVLMPGALEMTGYLEALDWFKKEMSDNKWWEEWSARDFDWPTIAETAKRVSDLNIDIAIDDFKESLPEEFKIDRIYQEIDALTRAYKQTQMTIWEDVVVAFEKLTGEEVRGRVTKPKLDKVSLHVPGLQDQAMTVQARDLPHSEMAEQWAKVLEEQIKPLLSSLEISAGDAQQQTHSLSKEMWNAIEEWGDYLIGAGSIPKWAQKERALQQLIHLKKLEDYTYIGLRLNELFKEKGFFSLAPYLAILGDRYVYSTEYMDVMARVDALTQAFPREERGLALLVKGFNLVTHLRKTGVHAEPAKDGQLKFLDNEILVEAIPQFVAHILNWKKENKELWDTPISSEFGYTGESLNITYGDMMLWGLIVMLDPMIHNHKFFFKGIVFNIDEMTVGYIQQKGWKDDLDSMTEFFQRILALREDIDLQDFQELVKEAFRLVRQGYFENKGMRSPLRVVLSGGYLTLFDQLMDVRNSPLPVHNVLAFILQSHFLLIHIEEVSYSPKSINQKFFHSANTQNPKAASYRLAKHTDARLVRPLIQVLSSKALRGQWGDVAKYIKNLKFADQAMTQGEAGFVGHISPGQTDVERQGTMDHPIRQYLKRILQTEVFPTIIDFGVGYPPLLTQRTALNFPKARVIGVDLNIPSYVLYFMAQLNGATRPGRYVAFYEVTNDDLDQPKHQLTYLAQITIQKNGRIYGYKEISNSKREEGIMMANKIRDDLLRQAVGHDFLEKKDFMGIPDISNSENKVTFEPMRRLAREMPNLEFLKSGFELSAIRDPADVIRAGNILWYYKKPGQVRRYIQLLGKKLKEGGIVYFHSNATSYFLYKKVKGVLVPRTLSLNIRIAEDPLFYTAQFPKYKKLFKDAGRIVGDMFTVYREFITSKRNVPYFIAEEVSEALNREGYSAWVDESHHVHIDLKNFPSDAAMTAWPVSINEVFEKFLKEEKHRGRIEWVRNDVGPVDFTLGPKHLADDIIMPIVHNALDASVDGQVFVRIYRDEQQKIVFEVRNNQPIPWERLKEKAFQAARGGRLRKSYNDDIYFIVNPGQKSYDHPIRSQEISERVFRDLIAERGQEFLLWIAGLSSGKDETQYGKKGVDLTNIYKYHKFFKYFDLAVESADDHTTFELIFEPAPAEVAEVSHPKEADLAEMAEELSWKDVEKEEGYRFVFDQVPQNELELFAPEIIMGHVVDRDGNRIRKDPNNILIHIYPKQKILSIVHFYPGFISNPSIPRRKGRGKALLRYLMQQKKYVGFHIVSNANSWFRAMFGEMRDIHPYPTPIMTPQGLDTNLINLPQVVSGYEDFVQSVMENVDDLHEGQRKALQHALESTKIHAVVPDFAQLVQIDEPEIFNDDNQEIVAGVTKKTQYKPIGDRFGQAQELQRTSTQLSTRKDDAMLNQEVGGINLDPAMLNLETKGEGMGIPFPFDLKELESLSIEGFSPIIFQIVPVTNLPVLLGLTDDDVPTPLAGSPDEGMKLSYLDRRQKRH